MGKHPIKPKMMDAVQLRLDGYTLNQISEKLETPKRTLSDWFAREDVQAYYQQELKRDIHTMFNKAIRGTLRDMDDTNPWIRQNAQRMIIDKFGASVMGEDKQEIVIHVSGGVPNIGMPERTEDD